MSSDLTILTLDAGGTNFVFCAYRNFEEISEIITLPAYADKLDLCLQNLMEGFRLLRKKVGKIDAISFAFPGPADYNQGIIGNLPNFPAFTQPVPLADILNLEFKVPVFINNDANLFAAGEARAGFLPEINNKLALSENPRIYRNLIGITLGTGFGCGIVLGGQMLSGDNSSGAEIHNSLNKFHPDWNAEEDVSTRAILREYSTLSGITHKKFTPLQIYQIAHGEVSGDKDAAIAAFQQYGKSLGASIGNVLTFIDGIVVIGGGLTGAWDLFSPALFRELDQPYMDPNGKPQPRLSFKTFNLENELSMDEFLHSKPLSVPVPGSDIVKQYDAIPRTGIGLSRLGVSRATALGAYSFAVNKLKNN
jgi:glucokinase